MTAASTPYRAARGAEGMVLLSVVMIMVVLGLLAAYLAESIGAQYASTALAQLSRQAQHAAAGGLDWGRARALQDGVCEAATLQLARMTVAVDCAVQQVNEDGTLYDVFEISAAARHGDYGNADFVRRAVRGRYAAR